MLESMPFVRTPAWPSRLASRVLVLAPVEGDAAAIEHVLTERGIPTACCAFLRDVTAEVIRDHYTGCAAVIIAQEAFDVADTEGQRALAAAISAQPPWSDLPLILLAAPALSEEGAWRIARELDPVGNITILERPLRRTTLLNAVAVALRARERQYQLRATLEELNRHRRHLSDLVEEQTSRLAESAANLNAAERLASLGTLAAGLGHDIANLTFPIRARLEALRSRTSDDDDQADLDAVAVALTHLSRLSAGMRLMSMDPAREASSPATDLGAWAAESEAMFRAALARHIRLECEIPEGLGVSIARHRLAQAVFNLVQNAGEAMAGQPQGLVKITAEPATNAASARMVVLRVSDNGPGMSPDVLAHCFEPYFSTKGRAIATGMGLGMVRGIVEAAGGTITVESALGAGTTFTLTFPESSQQEGSPHSPTQALTAAISIRDPRIAGFVCHCLRRFHMQGLTHTAAGLPDAPIWILDSGSAHRIPEFLDAAPPRRAVLLGARDGPSQPPVSIPRRLQSRVTVLHSRPSSNDLKLALEGSRGAQA